MQPTSELLDYIRTQRVAGFADDVLRQTIIATGWSADVVDQAFAQLTAPSIVTPPVAPVDITTPASSYTTPLQPTPFDTTVVAPTASSAFQMNTAFSQPSITSTEAIPPTSQGPVITSAMQFKQHEQRMQMQQAVAPISSTASTQPPIFRPTPVVLPEMNGVQSQDQSIKSVRTGRGTKRLILVLIILIILLGGGSVVTGIIPTSLSIPKISISEVFSLPSSVSQLSVPAKIKSILSKIPIIGSRFAPTPDTNEVSTESSPQLIALQTALSALRAQPQIGTHVEGTLNIEIPQSSVPTPTPSPTAGTGISVPPASDTESITLTLDSTRIRTDIGGYRAYALLRASTPTSVELDSQLFLTDNHILFRFNAMTLLSAVGIDVIGSWFAAEGLPTGLAVLDTVGLPGSALVSYLTAQRHMTTTQPLFASFLTGETVSVDEPISQIRGTRHVRTYHVTANASAFASMIAQQLRMRGGLLLPAESTVNQITNIFTTMQSDITVDAVTGLPIEMKLNLRGVTATGAPMTFDATITFTDAPTLVVIDEPIATNTLEQLVGIILKTLEQVPEGGL